MSSQKINKPKICKCGHSKNAHRKNTKSKIVITTFCRECSCSTYMNRKRPVKSDKAFIFIMPIFFIIFLSIVLITFYSMPGLTEEELKAPSNLTLGDLLEIFWIISFLIFYWLGCILVVDPIFDYFKYKNRPSYPIVNNDGTIEPEDGK